MNKKRIKQFLEDLTALSKKSGIVVSGCGCCGSPYLVDLLDEVSEAVSGLEAKTLSLKLSGYRPREYNDHQVPIEWKKR